jgi:HSP20 family molecular chaperone IbpA
LGEKFWMAKKAKKTKRKSDILVDLGGSKNSLAAVLNEMEKMIKSIARQQGKRRSDITRMGEIKGMDSQEAGLVYGFSLMLEEPEDEPQMNVFPKSGKIGIIAKIPRAKKEKIEIKLKDNVLQIKAEDSGRKYHKKISLPFPVKRRPMRSSYRNGVLRITLVKRNK